MFQILEKKFGFLLIENTDFLCIRTPNSRILIVASYKKNKWTIDKKNFNLLSKFPGDISQESKERIDFLINNREKSLTRRELNINIKI